MTTTLTQLLKDKELVKGFSLKNDKQIMSTFDLDNERKEVVHTYSEYLVYFIAEEIEDFLFEEIEYQENQNVPVSYLIKMLDESDIKSFKLVNDNKGGVSVMVNKDTLVNETDSEVVARIKKVIKEEKDKIKKEQTRYEKYLELKKEFGNV